MTVTFYVYRSAAGRLCDYSGMTYEALEEHGGIQWPFPASPAGGAGHPSETRRLYANGQFQTPDGRARIDPRREAGELSEAELDRLRRDMRAVIRHSVREGHAGRGAGGRPGPAP